MPRSRASSSALTRFTSSASRHFQQARGERGGEQPRAAPGRVAAVGEFRLADRALGHLRLQQAEPAGQIDVQPHFVAVRRGPRPPC